MKSKKDLGRQILQALYCRYLGEIEVHRANIDIYLNTPAGIGEHPDVLGAIDMEVGAMAGVRDKIHTLRDEWDFDEDE
tara:strand:+ start:817 stop:1050 length:234 start_codon:yes stop_codon:yes gene_type:complete